MAAIKKTKIVLAQPAVGAQPSRPPFFSRAPGSVRGAGDEAAYRASLRYRALHQDYQDLIKISFIPCVILMISRGSRL
ncbi:hypothetical protein Zm00014a_024502 [Zea mays]|uniref:Uncharacterized protein n=1 Tax=Zea mays TaxID=4577 RepID=A0A3L6G4J5_MAIZE|nr:hypothetical protein Zm00014a_024502 [Zea mays]PWZ43515.1 hypothetical protein Zm00014a_024502 [Zea mays]